MYRVLGTVMHAVMSADASCRGLLSPRNGPIVMEFTQGETCRDRPYYDRYLRCSSHLALGPRTSLKDWPRNRRRATYVNKRLKFAREVVPINTAINRTYVRFLDGTGQIRTVLSQEIKPTVLHIFCSFDSLSIQCLIRILMAHRSNNLIYTYSGLRSACDYPL
jgi:hypothetical protein